MHKSKGSKQNLTAIRQKSKQQLQKSKQQLQKSKRGQNVQKMGNP